MKSIGPGWKPAPTILCALLMLVVAAAIASV